MHLRREMIMLNSTKWIATGIAIAVLGMQVDAASLVFTGGEVDQGTGVGNTLHLMSLSDADPPGGDGNESGSVTWDGTQDVLTGEVQTSGGNNQTYTVAQLKAEDPNVAENDLGLVFNVNQTGASPFVYLKELTLVFQDDAGNTLFEATWVSPDLPTGTQFDVNSQGAGSAGWLFRVDPMGDDVANWLSDDTNRIGIRVPDNNPIMNANDGPENFFFGSFPGPVIPLPAAAWMGIALLGGMGVAKKTGRIGLTLIGFAL